LAEVQGVEVDVGLDQREVEVGALGEPVDAGARGSVGCIWEAGRPLVPEAALGVEQRGGATYPEAAAT
jgi:hypothetical protein